MVPGTGLAMKLGTVCTEVDGLDTASLLYTGRTGEVENLVRAFIGTGRERSPPSLRHLVTTTETVLGRGY